MWNINNNTFEHFEEYFGKNLNCDKIISYAPSANACKISPKLFAKYNVHIPIFFIYPPFK